MKHKEGAVLNMMKPFLCHQMALISGFCDDYEWYRPYVDNLERYFACYDRFYFNGNCGLYGRRWMIGVDNDPATFGRPRFSTANIFLNSFLVSEFQAMAHLLRRIGLDARSEHYLPRPMN